MKTFSDEICYFLPSAEELTLNDISHKTDDSSGSIGRRYARTDQLAIPFGITVDFDSVNNQLNSVALRDRDSREEIRIGASFCIFIKKYALKNSILIKGFFGTLKIIIFLTMLSSFYSYHRWTR